MPQATSVVDDVIELVKNDFSEGMILRTLQSQNHPKQLSTADMIKLKQNGVNERLIEAIRNPASIVVPSELATAPVASAKTEAPPIPKLPGALPAVAASSAKRIGVYSGGAAGGIAKTSLLELLRGDGSQLNPIALNQTMDAFRAKEAADNHCDFILEASFEQKPAGKGNFFSDVVKKSQTIAKSGSDLGIKKENQAELDKKNRAAENLSADLAPQPKDKVIVGFVLLATGSRSPILTKKPREVDAQELTKYLQETMNEVVTKILQ